MEIQFYGAAKMVTGSNYLIKTTNHKIMIDCGMFQGSEELEKLNQNDFPYNPNEVDFLILTHAHIDHSGRIPKLVKDGFRGRIITTNATYDLCKIMLMDSAKIQESDVEWENKKRKRSGKETLEPLYTMKDAEYSLKYFEPYFVDQNIKLTQDIKIRFKDAGHILGSAILEIWIKEKNEEVKIVFSGDLGMPGRPIINSPDYIDDADYLIMEATYGDTIHESYEESTDKLMNIINETVEDGGTVLIPSFAVGRTQELIYQLNKYYEYHPELQEYMKVPVYIDSPMAIDATEAFKRNSSSFNDEARDLILRGDNPFEFENLRYVKSQEESVLLNKYNFPKIIISSSGMATAGRIRHHLKHNLWNEKNSLIFVGYQAQGTLGRLLLDGRKNVKILGEDVQVNAKVHTIRGFSGHADQSMLLDWLNKFKKKPKRVFIVHAEEESAKALSTLISHLYKLDVTIPNIGDSYSIDKNDVELYKGMDIIPEMLIEDIETELKTAYDQFEALINKSTDIVDEKKIVKNYDDLKNKLIDLQHRIMDLNIIVGK